MTPVATVTCDAPKHRAADGGAQRRSPGARRGVWLHPGRSTARARLLDAMADLSRESGWERVTTGRLYRHAGLSRRVFESHFTGIEECFEQTVEAALDQLLASVTAATEDAGPEWPDRVSATVVGFLRFLDDQPGRAWMSIIEPLGGGDRTRFARGSALERLGALLGGGPDEALESDRPRPRTALDVAGGLWEMARQYLWDGPGAVDLDDVAGSTIFLALSPYLGRGEAMRYAAAVPRVRFVDVAGPDGRGAGVASDQAHDGSTGRESADQTSPGIGPAGEGRAAGVGRPGVGRAGEGQAGEGQAGEKPAGVGRPGVGRAGVGSGRVGRADEGRSAGVGRAGEGRTSHDGLDPLTAVTALAAETLTFLHGSPGAAGIDVSDALGVGHPSQTSRHLARLEELDLVWSQRDGRYKRWTLTDRGRAVVERLRDR